MNNSVVVRRKLDCWAAGPRGALSIGENECGKEKERERMGKVRHRTGKERTGSKETERVRQKRNGKERAEKERNGTASRGTQNKRTDTQ